MEEIKPKVGIVMLEKEKVGMTLLSLFSIVNQCKYPKDRMTIYLADTGSSEETKKQLLDYCSRLKKHYDIQLKLISYNFYNFAKINNMVIENEIDKDTELIILMNNDVELISDCVSEAVDYYVNHKEEVGTIGVRLMYPSLTIQHAGIRCVKDGKYYGFTHRHLKQFYTKEIQEENVVETFGNTGAFMLTPFSLWKEIGGLNEVYKDCFEDVEYNVECLLKGKKNFTLMRSHAYHRESYTRDNKFSPEDVERIRTLKKAQDIYKKFNNK